MEQKIEQAKTAQVLAGLQVGELQELVNGVFQEFERKPVLLGKGTKSAWKAFDLAIVAIRKEATKDQDLRKAIDSYLAFIKADYAAFQAPSEKDSATMVQIKKEQVERAKYEAEFGPKYIKIVRSETDDNGQEIHRSVHSFLDYEGNIWKAAGWRAPAKNFTRGSLYQPEKWHGRIRWTGAQ